MSKVRKFAEITPNLPFSEFNFYELYRETFEHSELGRMKKILPLHEKTSVIITTNKAPTEWVQTLNDEVLATAIIDRLLYRCEVIMLAGTSYRLENRKTIFTSESVVNGKQLRRAASTTIQTQQ